MPKVSIIVPVYNVEEYLDRSIDSLKKQTLGDIEIILVNDGSIDRSLEICKKHAKEDKRIKVIDKINEGVSSARNKGIEIATGEYIGFVDADDWVEPEMYENMYSCIIKGNADICVCNYIMEGERGQRIIKHNIGISGLEGSEIKEKIILPLVSSTKLGDYNCLIEFRAPWMYLRKKALIDQYNIRFKVGVPIGEDFLFNLECMNRANKIVSDLGAYYHYWLNGTSATKRYRDNYWEEQKKLILEVEDMIRCLKVSELDKKRLDVMKINFATVSIINECHQNNEKKLMCKLKKIREILNDEAIKSTMSSYPIKELNIKRRIWFWILKYKLVIFIYIYYTNKRIIKN